MNETALESFLSGRAGTSAGRALRPPACAGVAEPVVSAIR
jgi:hypothetical protein